MQETSKFKLGLFTLSALALFILAITLMGLFDQFQAKAKVFTVVEESVQGLTNGSPVKYKGVPIGNVTDILILIDSNQIQINFEVDLSKYRKRLSNGETAASIKTQTQFYAYMQKRVQQGLTCRIELDGITGSKYIEMDFFPDSKRSNVKIESNLRNENFYIPSTPSMMANLRMNALEILASIAAVDFKGISDKLGQLLNTANDTFRKAQLDKLVNKANAVAQKLDVTVASLNHTMSEKQLSNLISSVNGTIRSVESLSNEIHKTVKASAIPAVSENIRHLTHSLENSNRTLQTTLQKANDTLDAMTDLIRYVNENPSSVLRGRGKQSDPFAEKSSAK